LKPSFTGLMVMAAAWYWGTHALRGAEPPAQATTHIVGKPMEITGVQNAFRVTERIYSGSQPEGDAAFAALAKLGVKTIVSVDGAKPDVETAHKHGLRYVHLPFGYDGVPTNRVAELAKLSAEMNGPFYVHCHHGLHRGPTAVAILCEASEGWTPNHAETWMHEAGTAADYPGLYRSAREFKAPTAEQLAAITKFPEITKPSSLVETMLAIDEHFDWLRQSQKAAWKTPPGHADISAAHEATMLREQFREMARAGDTAKRPDDYRAKLTDAERTAEKLRARLRMPADNVALDTAFKQAMQSCAVCHKTYRNK
jgi:protein tyrosine phosphatase (PTP) superfamily phosphohydrolase (DUF442 family)